MVNDAYTVADKVLQYLYDNKNCLRTDIEYALRPDNVFPALDELTDKKFIGHNKGASYYHIRPEGKSIIESYGSYSAYISANQDEKQEQVKLTKRQLKDIPINAFYRKWGFVILLAGTIITMLALCKC